MYKVIKSPVFTAQPRVVKAPEPLFITNRPDDESSAAKTADDAAEHSHDELTLIGEKIKSAAAQLKKTQADLKDEEKRLSALQEKADLIMENAEKDKDDLLKKASEDAAKKIEDANTKAEEITQEAQKKGHDAGYQDGVEQAQKDQQEALDKAKEKAADIIDAAKSEIDEYYKNAEHDLTDIVMAVATKIIPQRFDDMPQLILPVVQAALGKVKKQTSIEVRVCPDAYEFTLAAKPELQGILEGNAKLEIVSDESLSSGDCWVETPDGSVDGKLSSQLEQIKKALQKVVGKYEADSQ